MEWNKIENPPIEPGFFLTRIEEVNDLGVSKYTWIHWFNDIDNEWILDKSLKITHWMKMPVPPEKADTNVVIENESKPFLYSQLLPVFCTTSLHRKKAILNPKP